MDQKQKQELKAVGGVLEGMTETLLSDMEFRYEDLLHLRNVCTAAAIKIDGVRKASFPERV